MRRFFRIVLRTVIGAILGFYGICIGALLYLRALPPPTTAVQIQRRVEALVAGHRYEKRVRWTSERRLPRHVGRAVIAAEDTRFFEHRGFDLEEIEKVMREFGDDAPRGASTITQQLVKNLFLGTYRSLPRKAVEATLTPLAEVILPKRRILELYLNVIEWGPGVYGIDAAARYHYRTGAAQLTRDQAARLAAVIPDPVRRRPSRMDRYSAVIQRRMQAVGW